jgi:hypothetical protein
MSRRQITIGLCVVTLLTVIGSGSASADETLPPQVTTTTVLEQFEVESGLIWSQIDEQTIEVRLPG